MAYSNSKNHDQTFQEEILNVTRIKEPAASDRPAELGVAVNHSRRSHRKSRYGCRNCKNRRLKCDETKPECTRCIKHGVKCDYVYFQPKLQSNTSMDVVQFEGMKLNMDASSMSLVAVDRSISDVIGFDGHNAIPYSSGSSQLTNLEILNTFITHCTRSMLEPNIKAVMRTDLIKTAFSNAHLMHTILAVSCLYLNRVRPANKQREVLEIYHWQRAIQLYQTELSCSEIGSHNTDALIGSCVLMGMNNLCPVGFQPEHSWVLTSNPSDLNWLALQGGLRCLIEVTKPFLDDSIWGPSFRIAEKQLKPIFQEQTGRVGLHDELADLCDINEHSTTKNSTYYWPVQLLSRMLKLEPYDRPENFGVFVTFMGQILPDFIAYLRQRDERALLLLSWWMALMCAVSPYQPWIDGRIVPECKAICMYLESTSRDPRILMMIEWPAIACGYRKPIPPTVDELLDTMT